MGWESRIRSCWDLGFRVQVPFPKAIPRNSWYLPDGVRGIPGQDQDDFAIPEFRHHALLLPALPGIPKKTLQDCGSRDLGNFGIPGLEDSEIGGSQDSEIGGS